MTQSDDIARYGFREQCPYCFFGMIVAGKCTRCDGRDAVNEAFRSLEEKVKFNERK